MTTQPVSVLPRLLLICDRDAAQGRPLLDVIPAVSDALHGDLLVQLREKTMPDAELRALAAQLRDTLETNALLTVNDRPQLAQDLNLGLHLPAASPPAADRPALLGRSLHNLQEAQTAIRDAADYAVAGTIFPTSSKPGHAGDGLDHLRTLAAALAPIPAYAIGGITAQNAAYAIAAGAHGVAVRSAILAASNPAAAARAIAAAIADSLRQ